MRRLSGFTLIELLAVIAIIAILAALIFPVYGRAKDSANRSDDMAAMNQLRTALQLYYTDQGGYPPALLGYATLYTSGPNLGQVIPADKTQSYLFPKRVTDLNVFQPAYNRFTFDARTTAVYPRRDPRNIGTAVGDLNGDGILSAADDDCNSRQAYGPGNGLVAANYGANDGIGIDPPVLYFYNISGYDIAQVPDSAEIDNVDPNSPYGCLYGGSARPRYLGTQGKRYELRYSLFWTEWGGTTGNSGDDPRQLGYGFPPDDTVITWNSYFRDLDRAGKPVGSRDIVLYLGGSAKMFPSNLLNERSWRTDVTPSSVAAPTGTKGGNPTAN